MIIGVIIKQPGERLDYDVDATPAFNNDGNDFVSQASVVITPPDELVVTPAISGTDAVKLWLQDGVDGTEYKIELTVETDAGRKKEDEILVQVMEF